MKACALQAALICLVLGLSGCEHIANGAYCDLTLVHAKQLIESGEVTELFQPHQGCVMLTLKNGDSHSFKQPHLDWIADYLDAKGLAKAIPLSIE